MTTVSPLCSALLCSLILTGCSLLQPPTIATAEAPPPIESEQPEPPLRPFAAETLFDLLVAEMAGARNDYGLALNKYAKQAFQTKDPAVVARATRVAAFLNADNYARDLAQLWADLEADNPEARRFAAHYWIQARQLSVALPHALYMLAEGEPESLRTIASYAATLDNEQRNQLLAQYRQLPPAQLNDPDVLLTHATLLRQQGDFTLALSEARKLRQLAPDNAPGLLLICQIIEEQDGIDAALAALQEALQTLPDNKRLRLHSARLWAEKDLARARQELAKLVTLFPDDHSLVYSLALISAEVDLREDAELLLRRLLESPDHGTPAHFQLGKLMELKGDTEQAVLHYGRVRSGQHLISAASRLSRLLAREDKISEAQQYLAQLRTEQPNHTDLLYQVEAEMLEQTDDPRQAHQVLTTALDADPGNEQLLYARSLLSERNGDFPSAERDLRTILDNTPDNPTALNALGYSLTNHSTRYREAYHLIERALALNPGDPATLDSMGWVLYRLGRNQEALDYLQRAIAKLPDPEVAAHLGEVLWALDRQEEAIAVWRKSLSDNPDAAVITQTLERLDVPVWPAAESDPAATNNEPAPATATEPAAQ